MEDHGMIETWRGKRLDDLTHKECLEAIRWLGRRVNELQELPIDWKKHALSRLKKSTTEAQRGWPDWHREACDKL